MCNPSCITRRAQVQTQALWPVAIGPRQDGVHRAEVKKSAFTQSSEVVGRNSKIMFSLRCDRHHLLDVTLLVYTLGLSNTASAPVVEGVVSTLYNHVGHMYR